jgi:GTP cyclohydrolase I
MNQKQIEAGVRLILKGIGADLTDRNFKDTPKRVAKLYKELLTPNKNNFRTFPEEHDSMIVLRNHEIHGICPHHLLPVVMWVSVGYIPDGRVLGLSKLARAAEVHLTQPVMQETLSDLIADGLDDRLRPKGVAVIIRGIHGCMRHRGVRTAGDVVTSAVRGVYLTNPSARDEFMRIVGKP